MVISFPETSEQLSNNLISNRTYELCSDVSIGHLRRTSASTHFRQYLFSLFLQSKNLVGYIWQIVEQNDRRMMEEGDKQPWKPFQKVPSINQEKEGRWEGFLLKGVLNRQRAQILASQPRENSRETVIETLAISLKHIWRLLNLSILLGQGTHCSRICWTDLHGK